MVQRRKEVEKTQGKGHKNRGGSAVAKQRDGVTKSIKKEEEDAAAKQSVVAVFLCSVSIETARKLTKIKGEKAT